MQTVNRKGTAISQGFSNCGVIDISTVDFSRSKGEPFNIKNDNNTSITLQVKYFEQTSNEWISTTFQPGWNPDILKSVKTKADTSNLKWGE